jgi:hypothetical protein
MCGVTGFPQPFLKVTNRWIAAATAVRHDPPVLRGLGLSAFLVSIAATQFALADNFHREVPTKEESAKEESSHQAAKGDAIDLTKAEPAKPPPPESDWRTPVRERRCGFSVGTLLGGVVGGVTGYPNDALKINRDEFFTDTSVAGGGAADVWLGIAIVDWLALGLGGQVGRMVASEHTSDYWGASFHVDAFPAYPLGGAWREFGVMLEAGIANSDTYRSDDRDISVIESGIASHLDLGLFYEGIRLWKFSMGPFVAADLQFSPSSFRPTGWLGWRTALYAGP